MWRSALIMAGSITSSSKEGIQSALKSVTSRIAAVSKNRSENCSKKFPRLVAVSKTKPPDAVIAAYEVDQRHFGENYVGELIEKSKDQEILEKCPDIKWHFIGHLQRNKVNKVISIPNLFLIETVESEKLAQALDLSWSRLNRAERLKVMVQVNTSGEKNKHGCDPEETTKIVKFIQVECKNLQFTGLMTIGSFDHDSTKSPNPDFQKLIECRDQVCKETGLSVDEVDISMGMSNDFEHAIELGSTSVRVGSTIFGARVNPNKTASNTVNSTTEGAQGLDSDIGNLSLADKTN